MLLASAIILHGNLELYTGGFFCVRIYTVFEEKNGAKIKTEITIYLFICFIK